MKLRGPVQWLAVDPGSAAQHQQYPGPALLADPWRPHGLEDRAHLERFASRLAAVRAMKRPSLLVVEERLLGLPAKRRQGHRETIAPGSVVTRICLDRRGSGPGSATPSQMLGGGLRGFGPRFDGALVNRGGAAEPEMNAESVPADLMLAPCPLRAATRARLTCRTCPRSMPTRTPPSAAAQRGTAPTGARA